MSNLIHIGFNETFIKNVRNKLFVERSDGKICFSGELSKKLNYYTDEQLSDVLGGNNKTWLSKELSRWKKKLFRTEYNFQGTINNLELFCFLTNSKPNEVLLSSLNSDINWRNRITFLSKEAINSIINNISANKKLLKKELILPVEYAPMYMVASFLKIYRDKAGDIIIKFCTSMFSESYNGFGTEDALANTFNISSPQKNDKNVTLDSIYDDAMDDLNSFINDEDFKNYFVLYSKENPLTQIITQKFENDMFFEMYYPALENPQKTASAIMDTLDNIPAKVGVHEER